MITGDPNVRGDLAHQFDPAALGVPAIFPSADGTGPRNYINQRGSFANDVSFIKQFRISQGRQLELRANAYNLFNNVRRTNINSGLQFKANGRTFADGFRLFNTPELNEARGRANGITDERQLYNLYRSGVGHVDLTNVQPNRIIEIGMAFRF